MFRRFARVALAGASLALAGCDGPTAPRVMRPQTVVLLATPKFVADFASPGADIARFLDHYAPLTRPAARAIVIFAVGNSEHVLTYAGPAAWDEPVEWARYTDSFVPFTDRTLTYRQIHGIVRAFRDSAAARGLRLAVFDQVDPGVEFSHEYWKLGRHPECFSRAWESFDIRGRLETDDTAYASAPAGIAGGKPCGDFLADQVARYVADLGFDGILYGNQLGTRGRWIPENGPGYTAGEAAAILRFMQYTDSALGPRELMWFDSYNNLETEQRVWSVTPEVYRSFDYVIASGFCVITFTERYLDDLRSKLRLRDRTRVLATLDWVDPWYTYNSMTAFAAESRTLEDIAVAFRYDVDGVVFFANDQDGGLVPASRIEAFAKRFYPAAP